MTMTAASKPTFGQWCVDAIADACDVERTVDAVVAATADEPRFCEYALIAQDDLSGASMPSGYGREVMRSARDALAKLGHARFSELADEEWLDWEEAYFFPHPLYRFYKAHAAYAHEVHGATVRGRMTNR